MAKKIVMNVLTSLGYEEMHPFNPSNLLSATTEVTSTSSNYNLTLSELSTPYDNGMGIVLFVPNVTNIANATITLNVSTVCNIKFEDGTNITDGVLVQSTPVLVKYYNGNFYLLSSKAQVGLINVDNTSDLSKPISTATQTALNNKFNIPASIPASSNLNTYTTAGMYYYALTTTGIVNLPNSSVNGKMFALFVQNNGNGVVQTLCVGQTGVQMYTRNLYGGTWGAWQQNIVGTYGTVDPTGTVPDGTVYFKYSLT